MTTTLLILAAIFLPLIMLVLTLFVNDLEKNTDALTALLNKRYTIEPIKKTTNPTATKLKIPGRS